MQRKLNEGFIKAYSEQFSEKITSVFFKEKGEITGKEILSVTPSKQVNFFILKILFGKWQEEMKKLESPFFNYKNTEVRRAMVDFMNTLSQHIEVEGDHFMQLVEEAVDNSLRLLVAPDAYLKYEFEGRNISRITEKVTKPIFKYIKLHKAELADFFDQHAGEELDDFLAAAAAHFEGQTDQRVIDQELSTLSEVVPVRLGQLLVEISQVSVSDLDETEETDEEDIPPVADADDFDDEPDPGLEDEPEDSPEPRETEGPFAEDEGVTAFASEERYEDEDQREEEIPGSEDAEDIEKLDFKGDDSVNEQYAAAQSTINDKFSEEEKSTVADRHQQKQVASIMDAISVNHRYMFTKELFDGSREAFNEAIAQVEGCESFDDAVELLVQNFAKEREWDMNSEEVKELLKMIFRKFR